MVRGFQLKNKSLFSGAHTYVQHLWSSPPPSPLPPGLGAGTKAGQTHIPKAGRGLGKTPPGRDSPVPAADPSRGSPDPFSGRVLGPPKRTAGSLPAVPSGWAAAPPRPQPQPRSRPSPRSPPHRKTFRSGRAPMREVRGGTPGAGQGAPRGRCREAPRRAWGGGGRAGERAGSPRAALTDPQHLLAAPGQPRRGAQQHEEEPPAATATAATRCRAPGPPRAEGARHPPRPPQFMLGSAGAGRGRPPPATPGHPRLSPVSPGGAPPPLLAARPWCGGSAPALPPLPSPPAAAGRGGEGLGREGKGGGGSSRGAGRLRRGHAGTRTHGRTDTRMEAPCVRAAPVWGPGVG